MASTEKIQVPNLSGRYLTGARLRLGITLAEAAKRIGCSIPTAARYEREGISGTTKRARLVNICKAYGIRPQTLIDCALVPD